MKVEEIKNSHKAFVPNFFKLNANENFLLLELNGAVTTNKLPPEIKLSNLQPKDTHKQISTQSTSKMKDGTIKLHLTFEAPSLKTKLCVRQMDIKSQK